MGKIKKYRKAVFVVVYSKTPKGVEYLILKRKKHWKGWEFTKGKIERFELKEVLQMIREEFSTQLSIREIKWSEPDYLPEIKADRLCIIRAFRNLVDNALKYGTESLSEIEILYNESNGSHILSVKDNGIGVEVQDSHPDIFSPFIRKKTSRGIQGSGLGLNILKEIAEKHGGEVWLEPGLERGVIFNVSIPKSPH